MRLNVFLGNVVQTMSIEEVGEVLGCGRSRVFEILAAGILERAPRFGRRVRILRASVDRALTPPTPKGRKRRTPKAHQPEDISLHDFRYLLR